MAYLHFVLGLIMVLGLALAANPKEWRKIKLRFVVQLLVVELALAWFMLNSQVGLAVIGGFAAAFNKLMDFAAEGTNFVFGGLMNEGAFTFFLKVLMPIVFISVLIGILQYILLLPLIIRGIGTVLAKINGMGKLESFNAISSMIVGQSENFIAIKNILPHINQKQMYTLAATAMSTVSMSIVGAYMQMIGPRYVVAALVVNMFSTFIVVAMINPRCAQTGARGCAPFSQARDLFRDAGRIHHGGVHGGGDCGGHAGRLHRADRHDQLPV